jgi:hypothetical protein
MKRLLKMFPILLLGALALGLAGCAGTDDPTSSSFSPGQVPSKDDASHGWGPSPN